MDFAAEGLLDGLVDERARAERVALLEELIADGVPFEELKAAAAEDRLVFLRVERTLGTARYTLREVAETTGVHPEDALRFDALRLCEVDMIKSDPDRITAGGTDWRFLNELERELKA